MDAIVAVSAATASAGPSSAAGSAQPEVYDVASFRAAWDRAGGPPEASGKSAEVSATQPVESEGMRAVFEALESLNGRADELSERAELFRSGGAHNLTPGDMLMITMHAHEFLFHSQMTANVANRTSDGVQQLFRQQS